MGRHTFPFDLGAERYEVLRRLAFERRVSIAALIREAVDQYLAKEGRTRPPSGRSGGRGRRKGEHE